MKPSVMPGAVAALASGLFSLPAAAVTAVDVELALLVDVSGSVSASEFNLQRDGYVTAFQNLDIESLGRKIAVTYIYWSGSAQQENTVGWTLIETNAQADVFAAAILAAPRPFTGGITAPGSAINFALPGFGSNDFTSDRQVIDVSGDGAQNSGVSTTGARDAALAAGIDQINGLPILGEAGLEAWYNANIKGGSGSFVVTAATFEDFDAAVALKIGREIVQPPIPEPSTYALMLAGLGALGWAARRRA